MNEFISKSLSHYRLAQAFDRACPALARWCDEGKNDLTRKQLIEQFEESWRAALQLRLPPYLHRGSSDPLQLRCTPSAVILRVNLEIDAIERESPKANLALKVVCRPEGGTLVFDPIGKLIPQIRESEWLCSVVARICDAGSRRGVAFYQGTLSAELVMG